MYGSLYLYLGIFYFGLSMCVSYIGLIASYHGCIYKVTNRPDMCGVFSLTQTIRRMGPIGLRDIPFGCKIQLLLVYGHFVFCKISFLWGMGPIGLRDIPFGCKIQLLLVYGHFVFCKISFFQIYCGSSRRRNSSL